MGEQVSRVSMGNLCKQASIDNLCRQASIAIVDIPQTKRAVNAASHPPPHLLIRISAQPLMRVHGRLGTQRLCQH